MEAPVIDRFHPAVRQWFLTAFGVPSPPQTAGWPAISRGENTLIVAPTGSGKTLAAFLWCINHLVVENGQSVPPDLPVKRRGRAAAKQNHTGGVRVLYISPLKALNNDIHRNLELPLAGIEREAAGLGLPFRPIRTAVRTGDTTQRERNAMLKDPPDILITTPESLYIMLSSEKARTLFTAVRYVIVDEIHAVSGNKRGVHLSLTLERLQELIVRTGGSAPVRIGLSATQRPLETVAHFLGGVERTDGQPVPRPVTIVDAGFRKRTDLQVICTPDDFTDLPMNSVWNTVYPRLLELIRSHRSTLVFVNNRRLAERIAAKLNEMLDGQENTLGLYAVPVRGAESAAPPARPFDVLAYHGSMSRTVRESIESDLKRGRLRALVTTSALELGIDIGSVDLVVQVQSPKGIARGLQRVGRSGHVVNAQSKGRIIVTHREDLLESAVVAQAMTEHAIERTAVPVNCLDVLAQQVVAMVAAEDWSTGDLYDLVRRSYCYRDLPERTFHAVLEMTAGRFSTEAFRELRARIVWDKLHDTLTALPGTAALAVTNAGTIPDRGYYGVYLEDRKTKVGEVDEEFIYESRTGDTFILGTNVWRMTDIDANAVIVQPAPGHPARMPFWRGETIGRPYELCLRMGETVERLAASADADGLLRGLPIDQSSARNMREYIEEQRNATHAVPSHRTVVVEGFRDDVGDPRIVVHSRFGKGVNGLLGLVLLERLTTRLRIDVQMLYNDDGILFRCSDVERLPLDILAEPDLAAAEESIVEHLPSSPLFGALFRQNAERALLLPKGLPGKRRPFFLQRLKAADLLQIVRQYSDFPIVIETMRECLTDVLDLAHFREVYSRIASGDIEVRTVASETPSPFAASLLFDFTMVYMYEWDDPKSAEKGTFARLNRDLLSDVVELDAVKSVVRNDAVDAVEAQLQHTGITRRARTGAELMEVMLRLGELTEPELAERCVSADIAEGLRDSGVLSPVSLGGRRYLVLTEELPLYAAVAGTAPADGERYGFDEALRFLVARHLRTHGPVYTEVIAERFGAPLQELRSALEALADDGSFVGGLLTREATREQWCYRPNLDRIHRASLAMLRREIKPATLDELTRFLSVWQHRAPTSRLEGEQGVHAVAEQMQGFAAVPEMWEAELFRGRIAGYQPDMLRSLSGRGELVACGTPNGRLLWFLRGDARAFLPAGSAESEELSSAARTLLRYITENGAAFLSDLREGTSLSLAALNRGITELFWRGLVTNDAAQEVLNVKRYRPADPALHPDERIVIVNPKRNPFRATAMRDVREAMRNIPGWQGHWSLVRRPAVLGPAATEEEMVRHRARQLLLRYGVVAREIAKREEMTGSWPLTAMELQRMEMRGEVRRGYFIEGLSGMQFALPEAVSMLDEVKRSPAGDERTVLNAADPANPYGSGIDLPGGETNFSRLPSNFLVLRGGAPVLFAESYGARLRRLTGDAVDADAVRAFAAHLRERYPSKQDIVVEYVDGRRPSETGAADILRSAGFYRDRVQTMRLDLR